MSICVFFFLLHTRCDKRSILTSCWCITGHPSRTFVSRCRKGRNDRISVPSSCSTHCSLIKTVTLYLLAACLARVRYINIFLVLSRCIRPSGILLDNNVQACRVNFRCDNPTAWPLLRRSPRRPIAVFLHGYRGSVTPIM